MSLDVSLMVWRDAPAEGWEYSERTDTLNEVADAITSGRLNSREAPEDLATAIRNLGRRESAYSANITHNLQKMADAAGIWHALWAPSRKGYKTAADIIPDLEAGLADLKARPEHFKQFDSPNGWGLYVHFVPFVEQYLQACRENPEAEIKVSR